MYIIGVKTLADIDTHWRVQKRYSEIFEFHTNFCKLSKDLQLPTFAPKKLFNMSKNIIVHRQQRID